MVMVNGGRHFFWTPAYEVSKEEQSVKEATMSQLDKVFFIDLKRLARVANSVEPSLAKCPIRMLC